MSKIASYLAGHLRGEVLSNADVLESLATDGSILRATPILAAYPYNTSDVRKIAHFAWQLAEKGHVLPLTPRGSGTSRVGAAIGAGVIVSMPTHFDTIFEVDTKQKLARVQPGVSVKALQQAMNTHGLEWPIDPAIARSTIGGAVGNNLYGERGLKYGDSAEWLDQTELVLSNGDILQTGRLSKRQLSKKKGLSSFEGEIYRNLDGLIVDNAETIAGLSKKHTSAGYAIAKVKDKKGNFDLTPLVAGSQGTLGIITELILKLDANHPHKEVVAASLGSLNEIEQLVDALIKLGPDKLEFIDGASVEVADVNLKDILPDGEADKLPECLLFIEFNDLGRKAKSKAKKAAKLIEKYGHHTAMSDGDLDSAREIWQVCRSIQTALTVKGDEHKVPVAIIEDALLSPTEVAHFIEAAHKLGKDHRAKMIFSAHLGSGVVHARPLLDLKNLSDKNKVAKLTSEYYELVIKHGGGIAGEYGEGRLHAKQNAIQFTAKELDLFASIKRIFDTHSIFNPGVKIASEKDTAKLDENYSVGKFSDTLPRL